MECGGLSFSMLRLPGPEAEDLRDGLSLEEGLGLLKPRFGDLDAMRDRSWTGEWDWCEVFCSRSFSTGLAEEGPGLAW